MKLLWILLVLSATGASAVFSIRFVKIECSSYGIAVNLSCSIKAYSRVITAVNFNFFLTKRLDSFQFKYAMDYKYGTIYREVMREKPIEVCDLVGGKSKNLLFELLISSVAKSVPLLIHKCPYEGEVSAKNLTMDVSKMLSIVPRGTYRTRASFSKDNIIFLNLTVYHTCESDIKTSF
ncbi:unnamed protein product [Diamesa serratosioi]